MNVTERHYVASFQDRPFVYVRVGLGRGAINKWSAMARRDRDRGSSVVPFLLTAAIARISQLLRSGDIELNPGPGLYEGRILVKPLQTRRLIVSAWVWERQRRKEIKLCWWFRSGRKGRIKMDENPLSYILMERIYVTQTLMELIYVTYPISY